MKTLFLDKNSFVRIKNINNKLIMFYSKFDKTALTIVNHKTLEIKNASKYHLELKDNSYFKHNDEIYKKL